MFRVSGLGARVRVLGFGQLSMGIDWEIGLQRHRKAGPQGLHFNSEPGITDMFFRRCTQLQAERRVGGDQLCFKNRGFPLDID